MNYQLHDLSRFPFVELKSEACKPGFGDAWGVEMDALLAADEPFVVAFEPAAIDETPADFKTRAQWFKQNRQKLSGPCVAMVAIVPCAQERQALTVDLGKRSRGLGVPYLAMASFVEARLATAGLIPVRSR